MNPATPEQATREALMHEPRFKQLAAELRCVVCQNQNLAESSAGLAGDLRLQVAEQIRLGRSDPEIRQYMVERYGEFVLYRPAYSLDNAGLWLGPVVLVLVIAVLAVRTVRRHRPRPPDGSNDASSVNR